MKSLYNFEIHLTLRGPILTKSTSPASFGLDAAVARDFRTGLPMLPGTLVEGRVRESLGQLGEGNPDSLFGKEAKGDTHNEPDRGTLLIGDLIAKISDTGSASLSRVAMDADLGSAKGEMLRVIETPFLAGDEVKFEGNAEMFCADDKEAGEIAHQLQAALLWQTQFGALRSTGFGKVLSAKVTQRKIECQPMEIPAGTLSLDLTIKPLAPLCVARHKIGDNLFESEDVLPGNLLAGSVMQTAVALGIAKEFGDQFSRIRFCHAFPTTSGKRPRALPLSTVKAGGIPYDIASHRDPVVLHDGERMVAPEFPVDWKTRGDALGKLDWAFPARELRVRTKIDSTKRTADRGEDGESGKLFAWEMVHPFLHDDEKTPVQWRSRIDLSDVDESRRRDIAQTLATCLAQLSFVSKTKTRCEVEVTAVNAPSKPSELPPNPTLALVLHTPAQIADPRFQDVEGVPKSGAISANDMLRLYAAAWSELSGGSLSLSHHFAGQRLAGGNYLGIRFQKKHGRPYHPWLLTDAGSVFVFTVIDAELAEEKLAAWLNSGLPLPDWTREAFGEGWDENPYRPQNGFGEVDFHKPVFATPTTEPVSLADTILSPVAIS